MIVPAGVRVLLSRHEDAFSAGDAGTLGADYRNPVAVFLPEGLRVEKTVEDTVAVLRRLQDAARRHGVVRFVHQITDVRMVRPDRPAVLVDWQFLDSAAREVACSRVRYFCAQQPDGRFLIEMLEYERTAFVSDGEAWPPKQP